MNISQIDQMPPGEALNILVAAEIMGSTIVFDETFGRMEMIVTEKGENVYIPLRAYSEDLYFAGFVITRMIELNFENEIAYWRAEDRPEIICKAALRAVLKRKKEEEVLQKRARLRIVK